LGGVLEAARTARPSTFLAPAGLAVARLVVVGAGKGRDLKAEGFGEARRYRMGQVPASAAEATIVADLRAARSSRAGSRHGAWRAAARLRLQRYKTKRKDDDERAKE